MRRLVAALLLGLAVPACGRGRADGGAAAAATPEGAYRLALAPLRPREEAAVKALAAVTGPNYVDDDRLRATLEADVVPAWEAVARGLAGITPPPSLAALHARFVAAARAEADALRRLAAALAGGDGVAVILADGDHRAAQAELEAVAAGLAAPATPGR